MKNAGVAKFQERRGLREASAADTCLCIYVYMTDRLDNACMLDLGEIRLQGLSKQGLIGVMT